MLLTTQIEIKITKANINYYKEKGYAIKEKDIIIINTEDLQPQSDKRVKYKCIRDSQTALSHNLADLLALYVEVV